MFAICHYASIILVRKKICLNVHDITILQNPCNSCPRSSDICFHHLLSLASFYIFYGLFLSESLSFFGLIWSSFLTKCISHVRLTPGGHLLVTWQLSQRDLLTSRRTLIWGLGLLVEHGFIVALWPKGSIWRAHLMITLDKLQGNRNWHQCIQLNRAN